MRELGVFGLQVGLEDANKLMKKGLVEFEEENGERKAKTRGSGVLE